MAGAGSGDAGGTRDVGGGRLPAGVPRDTGRPSPRAHPGRSASGGSFDRGGGAGPDGLCLRTARRPRCGCSCRIGDAIDRLPARGLRLGRLSADSGDGFGNAERVGDGPLRDEGAMGGPGRRAGGRRSDLLHPQAGGGPAAHRSGDRRGARSVARALRQGPATSAGVGGSRRLGMCGGVLPAVGR